MSYIGELGFYITLQIFCLVSRKTPNSDVYWSGNLFVNFFFFFLEMCIKMTRNMSAQQFTQFAFLQRWKECMMLDWCSALTLSMFTKVSNYSFSVNMFAKHYSHSCATDNVGVSRWMTVVLINAKNEWCTERALHHYINSNIDTKI